MFIGQCLSRPSLRYRCMDFKITNVNIAETDCRAKKHKFYNIIGLARLTS